MKPSSASNDFIISAFDREQWCPVLQARFQVDDLGSLRTMDEDADSAALVRFNVGVRRAMTLLDLRNAGPWHLASNQIPALNQCLLRSVVVVAMRDAPSPHEQPVTGQPPPSSA